MSNFFYFLHYVHVNIKLLKLQTIEIHSHLFRLK